MKCMKYEWNHSQQCDIQDQAMFHFRFLSGRNVSLGNGFSLH